MINTNQDVVPYNPLISVIQETHVNVEACFSIGCVKYLMKYVHKGHDRATFVLETGGAFDTPDRATVRLRAEQIVGGDRGVVDEIEDFLNGRLVSQTEAVYRLLGLMIGTVVEQQLIFFCAQDYI